MGMEFRITWDDRIIKEGGFEKYTGRVRRMLPLYMKNTQRQMDAFMRANAPWDDRTGDARRTLHSRIFQQQDEFTIIAGHGVWYGYWLEKKWGGKYGILQKTLNTFDLRFRQGLADLINGVIYNGR